MKALAFVSVVSVVAVVLLGACSPGPSATPSAAAIALPTLDVGPAGGTPMACAGIGLAAVLHGRSLDPQVAWLESMLDGAGRQDVIWPPGYTARFTPRLEVLDAAGQVVIRDGDFVDGGRVEGPDLLLMPPLLAFRLDCGPIPGELCTSGLYQLATANGWPDRAIAQVTFLDREGRYRLTYEDGSSVSGISLAR